MELDCANQVALAVIVGGCGVGGIAYVESELFESATEQVGGIVGFEIFA